MPKLCADTTAIFNESLRLEQPSLKSSRSTRNSLMNVKDGKGGLDQRRKALLARVPRSNDWARMKRGSVKVKDLAYLTAKTGDEFALLRGKGGDFLFHGEKRGCDFPDELEYLMVSRKVSLIAHSHPGEDIPVASAADKQALRKMGQRESLIISGRTGIVITYTQEG